MFQYLSGVILGVVICMQHLARINIAYITTHLKIFPSYILICISDIIILY